MPLMDTFQCHCDPGYTGKTCEGSINKCQPNPCQHDGKCTPSSDSFSCTCVDDWVGKTCQFKDPCLHTQCENDATCQANDQFGNFSCACPQYFTGVMCEVSLEPTDASKRTIASSASRIGGAIAACVITLLVFILLVVLAKKRLSDGTYNPCKEGGEAGRIELETITKLPPQETHF